MVDKAKYGERRVCHACGCKFYDMHRNPPTCPRCGTDVSIKPMLEEEPLLEDLVDEETREADLEGEEVVETDELPPEDEDLEE